ncbi:MAG: aminoacyl-histidine dipeptidase [Rikenellaceae bacterium]|nr:aminoacyl-histidine dipeptidase [Rikenellaceae bacterium]
MDKNITGLQPAAIWKHFSEICAIPHPSHHEEKIRQYVVDFARAQGLEVHVDEADNVLVRKPATPGMEGRKGIVLQAHLDMVPQKNGDKTFDFEKDPVEAYVDGEWVTANGTTLGADNGIGAASILAVLESRELEHGPLEALFTATEETGMDGAFGLKAGVLQGEILLNMDSETEGELYVGCAGGTDANIVFPYRQQPVAKRGNMALKLEVKGLKGGHSGIEIILQRANANKLMFRLLSLLEAKFGAALASVDGGGLRNAIPREAQAVVVIPADKAARVRKAVADYQATVTAEFKGIEESISVTAAETEMPAKTMAPEYQGRLTRAINGCPNGVFTMSQSMEGLVQTSNNLARVVSDGRKVKIQCLMRSSVRSEKEYMGVMIRSVFELAGAKVELTGSYDGWNPDMDSPILKAMTESYESLYGRRPAVMAIHAGLECGIIGGKYPGLDMISFGPTICYPHSPDEKVNIASVAKFWDFLCHTLKNAPKR